MRGLTLLRDGSFLEKKKACEQNHLLFAHLGDGLCDRRLPSTGGAIHPHNKCVETSFPLDPLHDLGKNGHARFRMAFGGIKTFLRVVERSSSCCLVKNF